MFDQKLSMADIQRKTKKWHQKIILLDINASTTNAKVFFNERFGRKSSEKEFKERSIQCDFKEYNIYKNKSKIIHEEDETNNNNKFIRI